MFATSRDPSQAYARVGIQTGVPSANPHQLVVMLFDGALAFVATARREMQAGNISEKGEAVSRAIDVIANGLKASLNFTEGADLADKLAALYDYMASRLLFANVNNSPAALDEVSSLLVELRSAWLEIASDPAVLSANGAQQ